MITASDGTAFTGSVTVYVTGDAGTQAVGSVSSGACAHEGEGYHTYAPAQGETNYDLVAFTFKGTGAIPTTVQIFTTFPQTGDAYATATAIETDTQDIQGRLPAALVSGRIDASVGAMATDVVTSTALAASAVTEIQSGLSTLDAAGVRTAVGLASANLDTQLTAIDDYLDTELAAVKSVVDAILVDTAVIGATGEGLTSLATQASVNTIDDLLDTEIAAIKAKTDNLPASPAATGDIPSAASIATAVLTTQMAESYAADGVAPTLAQAQFMTMQHLGESAISGTTKTVKKLDGSTTAATFTLDDDTTPTAITRAT